VFAKIGVQIFVFLVFNREIGEDTLIKIRQSVFIQTPCSLHRFGLKSRRFQRMHDVIQGAQKGCQVFCGSIVPTHKFACHLKSGGSQLNPLIGRSLQRFEKVRQSLRFIAIYASITKDGAVELFHTVTHCTLACAGLTTAADEIRVCKKIVDNGHCTVHSSNCYCWYFMRGC
jgi:hypothetical protein